MANTILPLVDQSIKFPKVAVFSFVRKPESQYSFQIFEQDDLKETVKNSLKRKLLGWCTGRLTRIFPINLLLCYIGYQILGLESFVVLIQTSSCLALKLAVVNGALLTKGHIYETTLVLKSRKHPP